MLRTAFKLALRAKKEHYEFIQVSRELELRIKNHSSLLKKKCSEVVLIKSFINENNDDLLHQIRQDTNKSMGMELIEVLYI